MMRFMPDLRDVPNTVASSHRVGGFFINIQNGLTPSLTRNNCTKDKLERAIDFLDNMESAGGIFGCLQEVGLTSDVPPPSVVAAVHRARMSIQCAGSREGKAASVAILAAPGWRFAKVFRASLHLASACVLGAELTNGTTSLFVASVKLPPNLDSSCSRWKSCPLQRESRRLISLVMGWARPYPIAFIGGDFNTTVSCCLDRGGAGCPAGCSGVRQGNLISDIVIGPQSRWCDAFRSLHPLLPGFTREVARLDYAFVPHAILASKDLQCSVVDGFPSDHKIVQVSALVRGSCAPASADRWAAPRPTLASASDLQKVSFARATENAVSSLRSQWLAPPVDSSALESRQVAFASAVVSCAQNWLPYSGPNRRLANPRKRRRPGRDLRAKLAALHRMRRCAAGLAASPLAIVSRNFGEARRMLRAVSADPGLSDTDPAAWINWARHECSHIIRDTETALRALNRADPCRGDRALSLRLWKKASSKRAFFQRYFKSDSSAELCSAIDPDSGTRVFEPSRVKELVALAAAAPFAEAVPLVPCTSSDRVPCTGACRCSCVSCMAPVPSVPPDAAAPSAIGCADVRCGGSTVAQWSALYGPGVLACPSSQAKDFEAIIAASSAQEVVDTIAECESGKAGGHDGLTIGLLKIACDPKWLCLPGVETVTGVNAAPLSHTGTSGALSDLISWAFQLGVQTAHVTKGLIRMIPKGPNVGFYSVDDMRPITLLSEIGKVGTRIMAARIGAVLNLKPELLHQGQRAFIANGDVSQCVNSVLDVFEEFNEKHRRKKKEQLHVVSYDVQRAFDAVQRDSIRATLSRFQFPPLAIDYICSSLQGATSSVITAFGPTDPFQVRSSVRQGDPLSPLIYVLFLDALHRGFSQVEGAGFTFPSEDKLCIASCGFADDLITFAQSNVAATRMHEWTRTFFGLHAIKINAIKTKYFCVNHPGAMLRSVCGRHTITARPPSESFRYLGIKLNVDLDWTDEISRLRGIVWRARNAILDHRMELAPAVDAIRAYVVPCLELGLQLIPLSTKNVKLLVQWSELLRSAALASVHSAGNISKAGFNVLTGIPDLTLLAQALRASALYQRLCLGPTVLLPTTACRLASIHPTGTLAAALSGTPPPGFNPNSESTRWNRAACTLWGPRRCPLRLKWNKHFEDPAIRLPEVSKPSGTDALQDVDLSWNPRVDPNRLFATTDPCAYTVFTDGSTPREGAGPSGYSAVIFNDADLTSPPTILGSWLKCSGNNFLAELCALVAAIKAVPSQANVKIYSDSLSCVQAIDRDDSAERRRLRAAARPMLTTLRRLLRSRSGHVEFSHVRAHTGGQDFKSTGNSLADEKANIERKKAETAGFTGAPFLFNEERIIAFMTWPDRKCEEHITGDVGRACRAWAKRELFDSWTNRELHQGRVAKVVGLDEICRLSRVVLRLQNSSALRDLLLAVCEWMPDGRSRGRFASAVARQNMADQWTCPKCPGVCTVAGASHDKTCDASSSNNDGGRTSGGGGGHYARGVMDETTQHILVCPSHASFWIQIGVCVDRLVKRGIPKSTSPHGFLSDREAMVSRISKCATFFSKGRHPSFPALRALSGSVLDRVDRSLGIPAFGTLGNHVAIALTTPPCPCGDRVRLRHDSCTPVILPWFHTKLGQLLNLDTDLFSSVSSLKSGYQHWCSFDNKAKPLGSLGSPWKVNWSGHFSLCAPWIPAGEQIAHRCLLRAAGAIQSCRPTRIVLVSRNTDVASATRCGAILLSNNLLGDPSLSICVLQNEAAELLCPIDWPSLHSSGLAVAGVRPASIPRPAAVPSVARSDLGLLRTECAFLPFVTDSFANCPPDLPPFLHASFQRLVSHDRYSGLLGLLPKGFVDLLQWHFTTCGLDTKSASKLAILRAAEISRELFSAARSLFKLSNIIRDTWRSHLSGPALEAREDCLAFAAHANARRRAEKHFMASCAASKARSLYRAQRHHVCRKLNLRTIRELLQLYPSWTFGSTPPGDVVILLSDFKASLPPRTRSNGGLRATTRTRPFNDGDYILLPAERRALVRDKPNY